MPNRVIRDGLLTSWRYERLSDNSKLFFFHLVLCADDLGCIDLTPTYLRRRVLFSQDSDERIAKLIGELADVDLLRVYSVTDHRYGFIPRFRQRVQIKHRKYPTPPPELYADDPQAGEKFLKLINLELRKTTDVQQLYNRSTTGVQRTGSGKRELKSTTLSGSPPDGLPVKSSIHAEARDVLAYLNEVADKHFQPTRENLGLIEARLKQGFSPARLREIALLKTNEWRADEKMSQYLRPKTLFAATNCSQYDGVLPNGVDHAQG